MLPRVRLTSTTTTHPFSWEHQSPAEPGHRGAQGLYSQVPLMVGVFSSDELSDADLPPLPDFCLLDSAETKMPKLTGDPQAKPPCPVCRAVPLLSHTPEL